MTLELGRAVAHGTVGGLASVASGGNFSSGFAAGAISSLAVSGIAASGLATILSATMPKAISYSIAGGISGGVASELTGGSIESGFTQGAYTALFNHAVAHGVVASGVTWAEIGAGIRGFFTPIAQWLGGAALGTATTVGMVLVQVTD